MFDDPLLGQKILRKNIKKFNQFITASPIVKALPLTAYLKDMYHLVAAQAAILCIIGFVIYSNFTKPIEPMEAEAYSTIGLADLTSETIADTVDFIAPYTPNINENHSNIILAYAMITDEGYLYAPDQFDTQIAQDTGVKSNPRPYAYTVAFGDTLTSIANRFQLKTLTLKYVNHLRNEDNISPGQNLKIPAHDLPSTVLARYVRQERSKLLASAYASNSRQTVTRNSSSGFEGYFIIPVAYHYISRGLAYYHTGIDFATPVGNNVKAAASGRVISASGFGWNGGYGKTIVISHGNGRTTRYAHLSRIYVYSGQWVSQGEAIGASGNTGNSTGPHLHFEVRIFGRAVNPF